jgi:hypothetical protein
MTQKYYTEHLLSVYIKAIQEAQIAYNRDIILQEDNDPLHGIRFKLNITKQLKDSN